MEGRMCLEYKDQTTDKLYLVFLCTPVQGICSVDIDPFCGKPFHPVGKTKPSVLRAKSAQRSAHTCISLRAFSKAEVIVGFRKVNHNAVRSYDFKWFRKIILYLPTVIVLKQLGIGPVLVCDIQNISGD